MLDFEQALRALKEGEKVARRGWNNQEMYLFLFSESNFCIEEEDCLNFPLDDEVSNRIHHIGFYDDENERFMPMHDFIVMKTAMQDCVPWFPSQTDMLSFDWKIVS